MTRRSRAVFFYVLVLLFIPLSTAIILYAQGWRLTRNFDAVKIGGISVRALPSDAEVRIDGKLIPKSSLLFGNGRFVNDLLPGTYHVAVSKEGSYEWQTEATVAPSLVSQFEYVTLIPLASSVIAPSDVSDFWITRNSVVIQDRKKTLVADGRVLEGDRVVAVEPSEDLLLAALGQRNYLLHDLKSLRTYRLPVSLSSAKKISFIPRGGGLVASAQGDAVELLDPLRATSTLIAKNKEVVQELAANPRWIAWSTFDAVNGATRLTTYNLLSRSSQNETHTIPGKVLSLRFSPDNWLAALTEVGDVWLLDLANQRLRPFASDARALFWSGNENDLAVVGKKSVELFSVDTAEAYWQFNLPEMERIVSISWYGDRRHIFVHYSDKILFLDFSDSALQSFLTAAETKNGSYDPYSNTLYFTEGDTLRARAFPR